MRDSSMNRPNDFNDASYNGTEIRSRRGPLAYVVLGQPARHAVERFFSMYIFASQARWCWTSCFGPGDVQSCRVLLFIVDQKKPLFRANLDDQPLLVCPDYRAYAKLNFDCLLQSLTTSMLAETVAKC